jgi:hypothetical protein
LAASLGVSAAVLAVTESWLLAFLPLAAGFFLDGDHLLDYYLSRPAKLIDFHSWSTGEYFRRTGRIFLFFHAWEHLAAWALLCLYFHWPIVGWIVGISYGLHLAMDSLGNHPDSRLFYFLSYRAAKKFKVADLCRGKF